MVVAGAQPAAPGGGLSMTYAHSIKKSGPRRLRRYHMAAGVAMSVVAQSE
jgi:hypothetical protein